MGSRWGCEGWEGSTRAAASRPDNVPCLGFALHKELHQYDSAGRRIRPDPTLSAAISKAARAGSVANIRFLDQAGCQWASGVWGGGHFSELLAAIDSGNLDVVRICLERRPCNADETTSSEIMERAIERRSPAMMQVLYEAGWSRRCRPRNQHPAFLAI